MEPQLGTDNLFPKAFLFHLRQMPKEDYTYLSQRDYFVFIDGNVTDYFLNFPPKTNNEDFNVISGQRGSDLLRDKFRP